MPSASLAPLGSHPGPAATDHPQSPTGPSHSPTGPLKIPTRPPKSSIPAPSRRPPDLDPARYAREAFARGLYVLRPDGGRTPIRPVLEPTITPLTEEIADAHRLLAAAARAAARLDLPDLGALSPLEAAALERRRARRDPLRLATARVDFMAGRALELNATIPAMQGYSDIVAEAMLAASGAADRIPAHRSNTADLLSALREIRPDARRMAIVARPGDSQWGELLHYARRFTALGLPAHVVTPDAIQRRGGALWADGAPVDLIYRHIFTFRLDPASDFARALLDAPDFGIVNPVALDLEAKSTLAELSRGADAAEDWLSPDERAAIQRRVPWTRRLDAALAGVAERDRAQLVLKRSWDYGGRGVLLGVDTPADAWREALEAALRPGDAWVVQRLVDVPTEPRTILELDPRDGAPLIRTGPAYVDLCAYTTLGLHTVPRGGASRVAARRVVNLLSGGGLAPVLTPDEAAALGALG